MVGKWTENMNKWKDDWKIKSYKKAEHSGTCVPHLLGRG
jgi:hypothetical protein